jgi:pyruvate dehydrogenase E1 component alpha subunit
MFLAGLVKGTTHLAAGHEAVAVGASAALRPGDYVFATYRGHHHAIARGASPAECLAELMSRGTGICKAKGGSMHLTKASAGMLGSYAIVGAHLPMAAGAAWSAKLRGSGEVAVAFFGDGATNIGAFHEALNLAAVWSLPVLFVCENNLYAMGTSIERELAMTDLALHAAAYGMPAWPVDGMDVEAVDQATRRALDDVRSGEAPVFLEMRTYRFRAHSMYDPELYRDKAEVEHWRERDPVEVFAARLREEGVAVDEELTRIEAAVAAEIAEAVGFAEAAPLEPVEDLTRFVHSEEGQR